MEPGGAERMSVNYANGLIDKVDFSGLICTRFEGSLKEQIHNEVSYLFLNKKHHFDYKAFWRLRTYCIKNKIEYIHAHSSSFFWAVLIKLTIFNIKVVWHDHYGNSEFLNERPKKILRFFSLFFHAIIAVNIDLLNWSNENLKCKKTVYLENFSINQNDQKREFKNILHGENGKKILCLANLRPQKNHLFLLNIAQEVLKSHKDWTFHLVGKDFNDEYSENIKNIIKEKNLQNSVFLYGSRSDTDEILKEATIGILTSKSEGLPVSLIEYGMNKLPVIVTKVGEVGKVVRNEEGFVVNVDDLESFKNSLIELIENPKLRSLFAENFNKNIVLNYSSNSILISYLKFING